MTKKTPKTVAPLDFDHFVEKYKGELPEKEKYLKALRKDIDYLPKTALGPYFWFVSTKNIDILDTSDNLHLLSPYKKDEWKSNYPNFLGPIMPEEDFNNYLGFAGFSIDFLTKLPHSERKNYKFSIYCRMEDKNKKLRWVVFQLTRILYNKEQEPVCALVCMTDLGVLDIINEPRMTILNVSDKKNPFYSVILSEKKIQALDLPAITKREREILSCIAKGMKTPEIADLLFISYNTVENHKKNLRKKTNTSSAGELINYVIKNQLM